MSATPRTTPRVLPAPAPGEVITADFLASLRAAVADTLAPPRDLDSGFPGNPEEEEQPSSPVFVWRVIDRTTETVRIEDPDDPSVYVDNTRDTELYILLDDGRAGVLLL